MGEGVGKEAGPEMSLRRSANCVLELHAFFEPEARQAQTLSIITITNQIFGNLAAYVTAHSEAHAFQRAESENESEAKEKRL